MESEELEREVMAQRLEGQTLWAPREAPRPRPPGWPGQLAARPPFAANRPAEPANAGLGPAVHEATPVGANIRSFEDLDSAFQISWVD